MEEFLSRFVGQRLDVYCVGAASVRGEVMRVQGGIVHLKDEDGHMAYIAIDKIVVVWETRDDEPKAGFVPTRAAAGTRAGFKR